MKTPLLSLLILCGAVTCLPNRTDADDSLYPRAVVYVAPEGEPCPHCDTLLGDLRKHYTCNVGEPGDERGHFVVRYANRALQDRFGVPCVFYYDRGKSGADYFKRIVGYDGSRQRLREIVESHPWFQKDYTTNASLSAPVKTADLRKRVQATGHERRFAPPAPPAEPVRSSHTYVEPVRTRYVYVRSAPTYSYPTAYASCGASSYGAFSSCGGGGVGGGGGGDWYEPSGFYGGFSMPFASFGFGACPNGVCR